MPKRYSVKRYVGVFYRERRELFNRRPDKTFEICFQQNGKKKWKTIGRLSQGVTAETAYNIRQKLLSTPIINNSLTNSQILDNWFDYKSNIDVLSFKKLKTVTNILKTHVGSILISEFTAEHCSELLQKLITHGFSVSYINTIFVTLRSAINYAIKLKIFTGQNPATSQAGFKIPKPDNEGKRWLTKDESKLLLNTLKESSPLWHDIAYISLNTGMRLTEIYRLKSGDVYPDTLTASVIAKGRKRQVVLLTPEALDVIQRRAGRPDELVFRTTSGKAPSSCFPFAKAVKKCGFNDGVTDPRYRVWFHTLRHTFASWLVQSGVDLYTVQALLRHSSPLMTQRYAHLNQQTLLKPLEHIRRTLSSFNIEDLSKET